MQGYNEAEAAAYIVAHTDAKVRRALSVDAMLLTRELIALDLRYMHESGVLDENGEQGDEEYDDDEAFEYIYEGWLEAHPGYDDDDMSVAAYINEYMDAQYDYLAGEGLADV